MKRRSLFIILLAVVFCGFGLATISLAQGEHKIVITRDGFGANPSEVDRGAKVVFENKMRVKIQLKCSTSDPFSVEMEPGSTVDQTFQTVGEFDCGVYLGEKKQSSGKLKVKCTPSADKNKQPLEFELTSFRGEFNMIWGDSIEFKNVSKHPLGVRITDGGWDSGEIQPGESAVLTPTGTGPFIVEAYRGEKPGAKLIVRVFCR